MKKQSLSKSLILLICALAVVSVRSQVLTYTNFMKYCPMNSNRQVNVIESTQEPSYDWISYYEDTTTKQRALLMVKAGDSKNDYKFIVYQKDGSTVTRKCNGTANWTFVKLITEFLFLSNGSNQFVCRYSPGSDSAPFQLSMTGVLSPGVSLPTKFIPYCCQLDNGGQIFVIVVEEAVSRVVKYTLGKTTLVPKTWNSNFLIDLGLNISVPLTEGVGNYRYLWDKQTASFFYLTSDSAAWAKGTLVTATSQNVVRSFSLHRRVHVFVVQTSLKTDKFIISDYDNNASVRPDVALQLTTASTTDLLYFSDNGYNFMRIGSDELFWLTLPSNETKPYFKSQLTSAEIIDMKDIVAVGFSKNMASMYFSSGKMEYYAHTGNNKIEKLFFSQVTNGFIDMNNQKQYFIWFKCICNTIQKYGFFSETLNGVILNKVKANCQIFITNVIW